VARSRALSTPAQGEGKHQHRPTSYADLIRVSATALTVDHRVKPGDDEEGSAAQYVMLRRGEARRLSISVTASDYRIVGMANCAPSLMPDGQRDVTVLVFV
jgi:hypothetical protein